MTSPQPGLAPLLATAALTTSAAPLIGYINRYNATAGNLTPTLPALSTLNAGANLAIQKDALDVSANTVTVSCAGTDTFDSGGTADTLKISGETRHLQVVVISATKYWKVLSGNIPLGSLDSRYSNVTPNRQYVMGLFARGA